MITSSRTNLINLAFATMALEQNVVHFGVSNYLLFNKTYNILVLKHNNGKLAIFKNDYNNGLCLFCRLH